jgi:hypothetical protein
MLQDREELRGSCFQLPYHYDFSPLIQGGSRMGRPARTDLCGAISDDRPYRDHMERLAPTPNGTGAFFV